MHNPLADQLADLVRESHKPAEQVKTATQSAVGVSPKAAVSDSPLVVPGPSFGLRQGYSHQAMVDLMIAHPEWTHAELCGAFGRPGSWMASVLASDAFQEVLAPRRHLVLDPSLTATMQERFKALSIRTSNVLMDKMEKTDVADFLVLKAAETAVKALGMGVKGIEQPTTPQIAPPAKSLEERLLEALDNKRRAETIDAEDITPNGEV